jgi:hypothetical protein
MRFTSITLEVHVPDTFAVDGVDGNWLSDECEELQEALVAAARQRLKKRCAAEVNGIGVTAALVGVVSPGGAQERPVESEIPAGPQSCYPAEIATLRELLDEQRGILPLLQQKRAEGRRLASVVWAIAKCEQRIEALTTAIEALGGAL